MPTYEYACKSCGQHLDVHQAFTDDALTTCPTCGGPLRKVFGNIAIAFKGSGFYSTDNRSMAKAGATSGPGGDKDSSDGSSKSETSTDSKSDSKVDSSSSSDSAGSSKSDSSGSSSSESGGSTKSDAGGSAKSEPKAGSGSGSGAGDKTKAAASQK
jgi:putative FmdB family regulatory protein